MHAAHSSTMQHRIGSADLDADLGGADFQAAFERIDQVRRAMLGDGLMTVSVHDAQACRLTRLWSSDPQSYPVGGSKDKPPTAWTRQVLQRGELFIGEGDDAVAAAFDDHERIRRLDLHSVVNVPLCWQGRCIGTFNVLRPGERWTQDDISAVRVLAQAALSVVLALLGEPAPSAAQAPPC